MWRCHYVQSHTNWREENVLTSRQRHIAMNANDVWLQVFTIQGDLLTIHASYSVPLL